MTRQSIAGARIQALSLVAGFLLAGHCPAAAADRNDTFSDVERVVTAAVQDSSGAGLDRIVTQGDVRAAIRALERSGWTVREPQELAERALADSDWLVATLRTLQGARFVSSVLRHGGKIDPLDRLSRMPHGHRTIEDLIRGPDGYKMIEYLTRSAGGRHLGEMLSKAPTGKNFNLPTGRIYTLGDLLAELKRRYDAAQGESGPQGP